MTVRPAFPDPSAMNATMLAIVAIGYVMAAVAPQIRAHRKAHAAFNESKAALLDGMKKFERMQESMAEAQALIADLDKVNINNGVAYLRKSRASVTRFLDDLDLGLVALERARTKVKALRRFSAQLSRVHRGFDDAISQFLRETEALSQFRRSAEDLRAMDFPAQFDEAIRTAIETATAYAMAQSLALSLERPRPTAESALAKLMKIHDAARAHGFKLGA